MKTSPIFLVYYLKILKVNLENLIGLALLEILARRLKVDLHRMHQFLQQDLYLELCVEDRVQETKKTTTAARMVTEISQIHKNLAEEETRFQKELEGYRLVDPGRSHTIAVADLVDLLQPCLILFWPPHREFASALARQPRARSRASPWSQTSGGCLACASKTRALC